MFNTAEINGLACHVLNTCYMLWWDKFLCCSSCSSYWT